MDLNEISVFIAVVQAGSFSRAAQTLGMPNSTVSHKVSMLEKRLGVTLIQRTTRHLRITTLGEAYFRQALLGLESIQAAESAVLATQSEPLGLLRVTAPVELGGTVLKDIVHEYMKQYPKVAVEVLLTDRSVDLLAEGFDLAIRAGKLSDSSLIAKKLGIVSFAAFASPKYLKQKGTPAHPNELTAHECIRFTSLDKDGWKLTNGKQTVTIPTPGRTLVNDLNMIKALATNGHGIALLPTFFCRHEVERSELTLVLPSWQSDSNPVHFVYPSQKFILPKLSSFIAFAQQHIQKILSANLN